MTKKKGFPPHFKLGTMFVVNENASKDPMNPDIELLDLNNDGEESFLKEGATLTLIGFKPDNDPQDEYKNPDYNEYTILWNGKENVLWEKNLKSKFYDIISLED